MLVTNKYIINATSQSTIQNFDAVLNKTSLESKRSDCHADSASALPNCASTGFDGSDVAPPSNTRGALSEHIASWLPQTRRCVSHLGEIKTPAAKMSNFQAESLLETIWCLAERISAGFCSAYSERISSALSEPACSSGSQPQETASQGTVRNVWRRL